MNRIDSPIRKLLGRIQPLISLLVLFTLLTFSSSCKEKIRLAGSENCTNVSHSNSPNTIMALGASRVEGARPQFESFRYELWKQLVSGGWTFDFIGTQCDQADYPEHSGERFDVNHEGHGGWTSGQILAGINAWLSEAGPPDIVLFSSPGGNDALQNLPFTDAVDNVNAVIDVLQTANPAVIILIEQMAPATTDAMTPELNTWFSQMQQEVPHIATRQTDSSSAVVAIDMYTDFSDALLADAVHYNEAGARFVADRYYAKLIDYLD